VIGVGEEKPLRIKACVTKETDKEFVKLEVKGEEDFLTLAKKTDSPIFECLETEETFVIDADKKIKYILKK
jgi:hypothetical protein